MSSQRHGSLRQRQNAEWIARDGDGRDVTSVRVRVEMADGDVALMTISA